MRMAKSPDPPWRLVDILDAARWGETVVSHGATARESLIPGDRVRLIFAQQRSRSELVRVHAWAMIESFVDHGDGRVVYTAYVIEVHPKPATLMPGPFVEFSPCHVAEIRRDG